jgi:predicted nuclease with RNAse H fold
MKTLGIDLASQPSNTASCLLEWHELIPRVVKIEPRCTDALLDSLAAEADAVGVDAPFGWPESFREAVAVWTFTEWNDQLRDRLTLRLTDQWVTEKIGLHPLRVSADRIAIPAMRAMALLHRNRVTDRSGPQSGKFFEVYPAASLKVWNLTQKGSYKTNTPEARKNRRKILDGLSERFHTNFPPDIADNDNKLDALIAALTAHNAKTGQTIQPSPNQAKTAQTEGWIHIPDDGNATA